MTVLALVESGDSRVECGAVEAQCTGKVTYIAVSAVKLVMCGDTGAEAGEPGAFCTGLVIGGTIEERPDAVEAIGASDVKTGFGDVTEGPDVADGSGRIVTTAAGDVTEARDAPSGSGRIVTTAAGDVTEARDAADGSGRIVTVAAGDVTEARDAPSGSGRIVTVGTVAILESQPTSVGCGAANAQAGEPTAECTGPDARVCDITAALGFVSTAAAGDVTEARDAPSGSGRIVTVAAGDVTEARDAADGSGRALNQLELGPLIAVFNAIVNDQYQNPGSKTPLQLSQEFQAAYISYGKTGSVLGVDIVAGGNPPALNPAFFADNTAAGIDRIADNIAAYWQTVITPGAPAHGGTVVLSVEVVPDVPALRAAIVEASTAPETAPGGTTNVLTAIQRELKTWVFIVTERVTGLPVAFFESII